MNTKTNQSRSISHSFGKPLPEQKSLREMVGENTGRRMAEMTSSEAFKKLEDRYNSGEITKREFLEGKRDLLKATK